MKWYEDPVYIKMCEPATEIQESHEWKFGDVALCTNHVCILIGGRAGLHPTSPGYAAAAVPKGAIWLPDQSQLQAMVGDFNYFKSWLGQDWDESRMGDFYKLADKFTSWEQLWLATLKEQVGFQRFIKMMDLGKAKLSDYDYCYIENWLITHPRNASVIAGRVPLFLSRKFGNYNIAGGHGHLGGLVYAEDGQRMCCDIGFSGDPLRFDWVGNHINTRPFMCHGSLILIHRNGVMFPYWLHGQTDWEAMKKLYSKKILRT